MEDLADDPTAEEAAQTSPASGAGDVVDLLPMVTRLRGVLGRARGKLRVTDVHKIAGLKRRSYYQSRLIARAMRHLGWERGRYRFEGQLAYAYAKGTPFQRENILEVERGEDGQLVVTRRTP